MISYSDLEELTHETRTLGGRLKVFGLTTFKNPLPLFVAAAVIVTINIIIWLLSFQYGLDSIGTFIGECVAIGSPVILSLRWALAKANDMISGLENTYIKIKKVREKQGISGKVAAAQSDLAGKRRDEDAAREALNDVHTKINQIRAQLAELAPGRQLIRFLTERAKTEDYRKYLGLVSVIRRDFEQLSDLLNRALKDSDPLLPKVDRIVLYIDDLDRCQAERVIEVLEAVHLLLAFPLFAVVVAVDPKWLRQSLLVRYPKLLNDPINSQSLFPVADPSDYLEKIFQIPFNVQRLDEYGFHKLVDQLFQLSNQSSNGETSTDLSAPKGLAEPPVASTPNTESSVASTLLADTPTTEPPETSSPKEATESQKTMSQRLKVTAREISDIYRFGPLFQTPRAVKRFGNTYSLIRVGIEENDWVDFIGSTEYPRSYRMPMLMLAVACAFPTLSRRWLISLKTSEAPQWTSFPPHSDSETQWAALSQALTNLDLKDWPTPLPSQLVKWIPVVERYSF